MSGATTATWVPTEPPIPTSVGRGTPRWWVAVHLLALLLTVVDVISGSVPLVSVRLGPDGTPAAVLTGYATAAILYALVWGRAARGRQGGLVLLQLAFGVVTVAVAFSLASLVGLRSDDWSDGLPLESRAAALAQDVIVIAALALLVRNYRDLTTGRVSERAISRLGVAAVAVALVAGPVAATVAGRTATPAEAVARTAPLLDAATLADAADQVRDRATWRPWEQWSVIENGWLLDGGRSGAGNGVGAHGLPPPPAKRVSAWLLVSLDHQRVCLTQEDSEPLRRGRLVDCPAAG